MNKVTWGERVGAQQSSWDQVINKTATGRSEMDGDELAKTGRMMIQLKQFFHALWGGEELISLIPASIGTSSFLQKRRTIPAISDWLATASKRWKPQQKLSLQDFLLICKLMLSEKKN